MPLETLVKRSAATGLGSIPVTVNTQLLEYCRQPVGLVQGGLSIATIVGKSPNVHSYKFESDKEADPTVEHKQSL